MENTILSSYAEANECFPEAVYKFLEIIRDYFAMDIDPLELEYYFTYGIEIPEGEEYGEEVALMMFEERLDFELSLSYCYLDVKFGDFFISDIMFGDLPEIAYEHLVEIVKIKMLVEYNYNGFDDVKDSIPEINKDIVSYDILTEILKMDYDMDEILEKIKETGMESLSKSEREFLHKKSRDI